MNDPTPIKLSVEQSKKFIESLLNPPAPNEALKRAMEQYLNTKIEEQK